jgi:hypothetical protein
MKPSPVRCGSLLDMFCRWRTHRFNPPLSSHPSTATHLLYLSHMVTHILDGDEGTSFYALTSRPAVLPKHLLSSSLLPSTHNPDFIRLLKPIRFIRHHDARRRYSSTKMTRIVEWKYCDGNNLSHVSRPIRTKDTPLADALRYHSPKTDVDVLPIG